MSNKVAGTQGTPEHRCMRPGCGRKLTSAVSIAAGYGPVCLRKIRAAAAAVVLEGVKPEQHAKALELIEDGGLVPAGRPGLFLAASSDGSASYLVDVPFGTCLCKAGQKGHACYHLAGGRIMTAAAGLAA
jgi:hypothetical protein